MDNPGVYILQSRKNNRYYIGSTNSVIERLKYHNDGLVKSTKNTRPFELKIFISCADITEAKKSEYKLKQYKRRDILEKVINDGIFPWNY